MIAPHSLRPPMLTVLAAALLSGTALLGPAHAQHSGHALTAAPQLRPLPLRAEGGWVVAVPPVIRETSVFGTLINPTSRPLVLRSARTPLAAHAMLMNTTTTRTITGTMTGMSAAKTLTVPARGRLLLNDRGAHVMLMGLKRPLRVGEVVAVTLVAADGRSVTLNATVKKP